MFPCTKNRRFTAIFRCCEELKNEINVGFKIWQGKPHIYRNTQRFLVPCGDCMLAIAQSTSLSGFAGFPGELAIIKTGLTPVFICIIEHSKLFGCNVFALLKAFYKMTAIRKTCQLAYVA